VWADLRDDNGAGHEGVSLSNTHFYRKNSSPFLSQNLTGIKFLSHAILTG